MNNLYIIASAEAGDMNAESALWNALRACGWSVRDIHELPRLEKNDIIVTRPELARLVRKRFGVKEKSAYLIVLRTNLDTLLTRTAKGAEGLRERAEKCENLCEDGADVWFQGEDLKGAAILIQRYIERQEATA